MGIVEKLKRQFGASDLNEYLERKGKIMAEPGIISKAFRIAREFARWTKAGNPVRTQEQITHIFNTFCKPCDHFAIDHCKVCGCKINEGVGLNKIRWATSSCPLDDKPKWVSTIDIEVLDEDVDEQVTETGLLIEDTSPEPIPEPAPAPAPVPAPAPAPPKKSGCGCS